MEIVESDEVEDDDDEEDEQRRKQDEKVNMEHQMIEESEQRNRNQ